MVADETDPAAVTLTQGANPTPVLMIETMTQQQADLNRVEDQVAELDLDADTLPMGGEAQIEEVTEDPDAMEEHELVGPPRKRRRTGK